MRPKLRFPCAKPWSELEGQGTERHCQDCGHSVQNYSLLSPAEAKAVLSRGQSERVCLFGLADAEGHLLPREALPQAALRWLRARAGAASTAAALGLAVQPSACEVPELPTPVDEAAVVAKVVRARESVASPAEEGASVLSEEDWQALLEVGGYIDVD